ncbi:hypothetical protein NC651_018271 [Populus alba x Populus x berolinensis]|nr:hypothetical protein NC651_018271 [Populus alba x Populus x berolinensis]
MHAPVYFEKIRHPWGHDESTVRSDRLDKEKQSMLERRVGGRLWEEEENTEGEYAGLEHEVVPGVVESLKYVCGFHIACEMMGSLKIEVLMKQVITKFCSERIAKYAFDLHYTTEELGDTRSEVSGGTFFFVTKEVLCSGCLVIAADVHILMELVMLLVIAALDKFSSCPLIVSYVSAQTSTSGILVKDVLPLPTEDGGREFVESICHIWVQCGSFLDIEAPNGLLWAWISVPSVLSRKDLIAEFFLHVLLDMMELARSVSGTRVVSDLEENPFNSSQLFLILGLLLHTWSTQPIQRSRRNFIHWHEINGVHLNPRIPFEYCYDMSPDANASLVPV